jgi:hypothetical protein
MSVTPVTPSLLATQVLGRLQDARERISSGWPSLALALAGLPTSTAQARLHEAAEAVWENGALKPWVQVLTEAILAVDEAREAWGETPDAMPPMTSDLAPCGVELRSYLAAARACAEKQLAWEDPGGLSRPQALCVVHLAISMALWRAAEQRHEAAAAKAQAEVDRGRQERAAVAARAIWMPGSTPRREPETKQPRSLRDLASMADAFADWGEDES